MTQNSREIALDCAVRVATGFATQGEYDLLMDNTALSDFGQNIVLPLADVFLNWLEK